MERCWAEDERARPSFDEVLAELDDLRQCESAQARLRGGDSQRYVCANRWYTRVTASRKHRVCVLGVLRSGMCAAPFASVLH